MAYGSLNLSSDTTGGCESGGCSIDSNCNQMEVFDWLGNMELPSGQKEYELMEVRFKADRKELYRNTNGLSINIGDVISVEANSGYDIGVVTLTGELVRIQKDKKFPKMQINEFKKINRLATQDEINKWQLGRQKEKDLMYQSRIMAEKLGLVMKISDVELQADLTKATFYYTAEGRVDFRQLIKDMASSFKIKIEMHQIGARQEAGRLGGIGPCGRELCCSSWLTDFRTVSTSAARYQQLSLNPQKLTGLCGKLKCCLNYELDMYLEGIKSFPNPNIKLKIESGDAIHVKTDIFKKVMWYSTRDSNALIALKPESVRDIQALNQKGVTIKDLQEYSVSFAAKEPVSERLGFIGVENDVHMERLTENLMSSKKNNYKKRNNRKMRDKNRPSQGKNDNIKE